MSKGKEKDKGQEVQSGLTFQAKIGLAPRRQEPDEKPVVEKEEAWKSSSVPKGGEMETEKKAPTMEEIHKVASEQVDEPLLNLFTTGAGGPTYSDVDVQPLASLDMDPLISSVRT
jgi:hypothetical protein